MEGGKEGVDGSWSAAQKKQPGAAREQEGGLEWRERGQRGAVEAVEWGGGTRERGG